MIFPDLTEIYTFTLQGAVQRFLWVNNQAILHSDIVPIKYKHLKTVSFCVICDYFDQNTSSFYAFERL
jgi:hypothetical protein